MTPEAQQKYRLLNATGIVKYSDGIYDTLRTGIKVVTGACLSHWAEGIHPHDAESFPVTYGIFLRPGEILTMSRRGRN